MNGPSFSTYLPHVVALLFVLMAGVGSLIAVLSAAKWVMKAYQSGPALVGRVQALENRLEEMGGEMEVRVAEVKAEAAKRYRADRAKVKRAEKAGTVDQLDPDLQALVSATPMLNGAPPPNTAGSPGLPTIGPATKAELRARARQKGFGNR